MQPEHIQREPPVTRSLAQLEAIIEHGLTTFIDVGQALNELRSGHKYRDAGYTDFDTYCRERWNLGRWRAHQLITASTATTEMSSALDIPLPTVARHAEELARIADPQERAAVWREVNAPDQPPPTGPRIRALIDQRQQRLDGWPLPEPLEPHAGWSGREIALWNQLQDGATVVVNFRTDQHLIEAARATGLFVRIDRESDWGNPFETPADGDRATVVHNYAVHYLPFKPSFERRRDELRGKALGCWCAPARCHGDVLKGWIEERIAM